MYVNNLKFNFGFLIDASPGTSNEFEFDYPKILIEDEEFIPLEGSFSATRTGEGILIQGKFVTTAQMALRIWGSYVVHQKCLRMRASLVTELFHIN